VVICLVQGEDCLHMVQLMPLHTKTTQSLASFKARQVYLSGTSLPRLSWKRQLNGCSSNSSSNSLEGSWPFRY